MAKDVKRFNNKKLMHVHCLIKVISFRQNSGIAGDMSSVVLSIIWFIFRVSLWDYAYYNLVCNID